MKLSSNQMRTTLTQYLARVVRRLSLSPELVEVLGACALEFGVNDG